MIISRLYGGLGNQMFQYALGRALAVKNNTSLGLDVEMLLDRTPRKNFTYRDYDLDIFNIRAEIINQSQTPFRYKKIGKGIVSLYMHKLRKKLFPSKGIETNYHFNESILSLGDNTYLSGYWQSYKYFESIADIIRKDFTLLQELPQHIQTLKEEIISKNSVCLHVRRGDYVGSVRHEVVGVDYYKKAIEIVSNKTIIDHIYVFSNDAQWCEENLSFGYPMTVVGEEYRGYKESGHFELMRACKHAIIANSSFSWWAAWLGDYSDKVIVAPKKWFGDTDMETPDLIPKEWIRI